MSKSHISVWAFRACMAILFIFTTTVFLPSSRAEDVAVVVANMSVSADSLSRKDVKSIFLGKKSRIGDEDIVIVTLDGGGVHKSFLKGFVRKTHVQYSTYWKKLAFTGRAEIPESFASEDALLAFVSRTRGAVGYASSAASGDSRVTNGSVKILRVAK